MNIPVWWRALCLSALTVACIPSASAAETIGFVKDGGGIFKQYEVNGVPLLDSFYFLFTDFEDRNIHAISVLPASPVPNPCFDCSPVPAGQLFLTFQDEEGDEAYFYRVSHVELSAPVLRHRDSDYCRKSCTRLLDAKPRDSVFVIVGFSFFYPGRDHHIERIGLWEKDGVLEVYFHDDSHHGDDDLFRYELEYVYLPASLVARQGHVSGDAVFGSDSATLPFQPPTQVPGAIGPTVLSGFDFYFLPELDVGMTYDQEIREIGVRTPGNKIEVFFANEELDRFNWGIDWAALANVPVSDPGTPRR